MSIKFSKRETHFLLVLLLMGLLTYCTNDELPAPDPAASDECDNISATYDTNIKPIIDNSCAYSGCHLGSAPGRYDTYEGMLPNLQNGLILQRVITLRDDPNVGMPPNYAPSNRPQDLSDEDFQLIKCWLENGFPK
ncbi:MAG: hypothetical protein AAFO07_27340 [Bacteroidota bacterium]